MSNDFEIDSIRATQEPTILDVDVSGPHTIFISGISKWSDFEDAELKKVDRLKGVNET